MKICIVGAGAIGGYLAGHLARSGAEVSLVARGANLTAIRARGLRVMKPDEDFTVRVQVTDDPAALGPQDYVFLALKAHHVTGALDSLRPLMGPGTAVVPPTTGIPYWYFYRQVGPFENMQIEALDPGGRQWHVLGPHRAIGCAFWIGAELIEPGVVRQDGGQAGFPLGEPDGSESTRVVRLHQAMTAGGLRAPVRRAIRGDIWIKMINSLVWNPIATLTLARLGDIERAPDVVALARRMMAEADAVPEAFGISLPVPMEKRIAGTLATREHKMSMLQDLRHGRPLEVDVLANSFYALRDLVRLPTPTIDTVLALTRLRAHTAAAGPAER